MIVIRPAVESDIEAIATVNIQSWKETYPGIMPAKKLAALNLERCIRNWQLSMQSGTFVFVAEREGQIVGFVSGGKNRTSEISECGLGDACDCELAAIYILRKYHRQGIGLSLVKRFAACMHSEGYNSMVIWVAQKNPATGFYEAIGGELVDRRNMIIFDEAVPVVAYSYKMQNLL